VTVKLRSVSNPKPAKLVITGDNEAIIYLDEPQYGISPGQAAVCYQENRTVGGGWIIQTDQKKESLAA
jgi:tRNA-specific 2-thiouridylase